MPGGADEVTAEASFFDLEPMVRSLRNLCLDLDDPRDCEPDLREFPATESSPVSELFPVVEATLELDEEWL